MGSQKKSVIREITQQLYSIHVIYNNQFHSPNANNFYSWRLFIYGSLINVIARVNINNKKEEKRTTSRKNRKKVCAVVSELCTTSKERSAGKMKKLLSSSSSSWCTGVYEEKRWCSAIGSVWYCGSVGASIYTYPGISLSLSGYYWGLWLLVLIFRLAGEHLSLKIRNCESHPFAW